MTITKTPLEGVLRKLVAVRVVAKAVLSVAMAEEAVAADGVAIETLRRGGEPATEIDTAAAGTLSCVATLLAMVELLAEYWVTEPATTMDVVTKSDVGGRGGGGGEHSLQVAGHT